MSDKMTEDQCAPRDLYLCRKCKRNFSARPISRFGAPPRSQIEMVICPRCGLVQEQRSAQERYQADKRK
jgi:uncharacterized CHY-type Zn-finger protein